MGESSGGEGHGPVRWSDSIRGRGYSFALNTIREKHVVPESAGATVEGFTGNLFERLRRNLAAARQRGELAAESDPGVLAEVLAVFDMGLLSYRSLGADPGRLLALVEQAERLLV